ncbi:MAG: gamma carbonic anhydrase family protein [Planctomycetota bacterium]|nr:gamma carbonic anhydrase family protein [Planctomycetota bacterium]
MPGPLNTVRLPDGNFAYVAPNAAVTRDVKLHKDVNIWYGASVRGDEAPISIGAGTNVQDNAVLHCDTDVPCISGRTLPSATGLSYTARQSGKCLVGMGAVILSGAKIGPRSLVAAGALVTPGKEFPQHSLILGSPAKAVRKLTEEEIASLDESWRHYVELAKNSLSIEFIGGENVS